MANYLQKYDKSWALVVGVNEYSRCSPLGFARQDAEAVAKTLESNCGFDRARITLLTDSAATADAIRRAYLSYTRDEIGPDDRVVVFFAGHGHTRSDSRGEVGFLVPVDGNTNDLASLIRWDDLTRNSSLIPAKHVLFIMDACYGGLAVARALAPGSARFMSNMLERYARQVLSAGKANEVVADSGGPRVGHSVFTGHLLDAIEGAAATPDGVLSTNAVISYVYDKVAKDVYSRQTPHYGYIDGDGDLILRTIPIAADAQKSLDVVIETPVIDDSSAPVQALEPSADLVKRLLSDPSGRIQLEDHINGEVRRALALTADKHFPPNTPYTLDEIQDRLKRYSSALHRLTSSTILLAKWGDPQHQLLIKKVISRLSDGTDHKGGLSAWLGLRWYPIERLMYLGGVAAMSCENGDALRNLFFAPVRSSQSTSASSNAIEETVNGMLDVERATMFQRIPNYERRYTPKSDYLLTDLQPQLEDILFLGREYEECFDSFELMYSFVYADLRDSRSEPIWAPIGRFGWKFRHGMERNPVDLFISRAVSQGDNWFATKAGLFSGSISRFRKIATAFRNDVIAKLNWH